MHRLLAPLLVLALSSSASAQTVSAIIPMSAGQPSAGGFRDIPPGPQYFQVTIQSNSGSFPLAGMNGGNSQLTWVPQGPVQGVTAITWATTTSATESQIGTVSGWAYFMGGPPPGYTVSNFYTTNAYWADVYDDSGNYPGGPYYDAGVGVGAVDDSLAASFSSDTTTGFDLPQFTIQDPSQNGSLWFNSDSADVAVYWLAPGASTWAQVTQSQPIQLSGVAGPPGQLQIHTDQSFTGQATVTLHYLSANSVNPGSDGDTLDLLVVGYLGLINVSQ
jgi:hypothetical protein